MVDIDYSFDLILRHFANLEELPPSKANNRADVAENVRTISQGGATTMTHADQKWPFLDPPNTAVITNVRILDEEHWVHYVSHEAEDGAWQFHPFTGPASMQEAAVVSLKSILDLEPRIEE